MAGTSHSVAAILQQVRDGAVTFSSAVTSKLAPVAGNAYLAKSFAQALSVFDMAIAVFAGQAVKAAPAAAAAAAPPVSGQGMMAAGGSCVCAVTCPVGLSMR